MLRLLIVLLAAALAGCGERAPEQPTPAQPARTEPQPTGRLDRSFGGTPAPTATFLNPEGEPVNLADFRGKPLLVNLWATWCAPCVAEMPTLDALAARERGLQVLTVSQDLDGRAKVEAFFAQRRFAKLEPYLDPELKLMTELGIGTLPTTLLYDAQGREVWRMTGMEDWEASRAAGLLKEATSG